MASARYTLNIKPEDLKPDEEKPLTPKEKRANFWYYNKWKIAAGLLLVVVVGIFIADVVGKVEPDLNIAVVCQKGIPDAVTNRLGDALVEAGLVPDLNGDGRQMVTVNQYNLNFDEGEQVDYATQMASSVKMVTDLQVAQSVVFLMDNPALMDEYYDCFSEANGAVLVPLEEAAGFAGLDLTTQNIATGESEDGGKYLEGFTLVRRGLNDELLADEENAANIAASNALFAALTGVQP